MRSRRSPVSGRVAWTATVRVFGKAPPGRPPRLRQTPIVGEALCTPSIGPFSAFPIRIDAAPAYPQSRGNGRSVNAFGSKPASELDTVRCALVVRDPRQASRRPSLLGFGFAVASATLVRTKDGGRALCLGRR